MTLSFPNSGRALLHGALEADAIPLGVPDGCTRRRLQRWSGLQRLSRVLLEFTNLSYRIKHVRFLLWVAHRSCLLGQP
jgi:hypothetical protein